MEQKNLDKQQCLHYADERKRFLGAAVPPIYESAPFVFATYEDFIKAAIREEEHYVYWRGTNPTVEIAEQMLAALEGGEACKCFASGMAAIAAALLSSLSAGDHVLLAGNIYETTVSLLKYLQKFQIEHTMLFSTKLEDIEYALQSRTKVIFLENPTSLTLDLVNIQQVAQLAKLNGIKTIIDNTWATPYFQKPLSMGIDMVVHSTSKYLGGHNDLVGGAVITSQSIIERMFYKEYQLFGASMAPFEAWLLIRGLRTLPFRMEAHQENALEVARFLEKHPAVLKVNYPALSSHPQYQLGKDQLTGYSGLFTFELAKEGFEKVSAVINRLRRFKIAVSWGSYESQVVSPNYGFNEETLKLQNINPAMIRLAVGLEPASLLIEDLEHALNNI